MSDLDMKIRLYGLAPGSIVDGPGIRYAVFMQGCVHHCPGCHNPTSQPHRGGKELTVEEIVCKFEESSSSTGVTLSGGEPFDQADVVCELAAALKEKGINIWCYSGYKFETLLDIANKRDTKDISDYCNLDNSEGVKKLLENIDVLVDGPFILDKKSYAALYCGSTNQRLIDVKRSLAQGEVVLWEDNFELPDKPTSW